MPSRKVQLNLLPQPPVAATLTLLCPAPSPLLPALPQFVNLSYSCGCCCCCCGGLVLTLNFSRQANIIDWKSNAKTSGTCRSIKLARSDAQEAYNQLQAMLQQRAANKPRK